MNCESQGNYSGLKMKRASAAGGTCTDSGKLLRPRLVGRTIAGKPIKLPRNMNRISACSEKGVGKRKY